MNQHPDRSVYEQTFCQYLDQLKSLEFEGKQELLGVTLDDGAVMIPYFGQVIRFDGDGLTDEAGNRPDFSDCVVLCRYLIMCPSFESKAKDWVAYRDFPDAGPLTVFWADAVERPLAKSFSGHLSTLSTACASVGGRAADMDITCDLCWRFMPLPKMPLLLIFNDADEDFPASASLLFEKRASSYLDAESQAILGHGLTQRLLAAAYA